MKLSMTILGKQFGVTVFETTPAAPPSVDLGPLREEFENLRREFAEQKRWASWQQNARNTGGQFGFGVSPRPIEYTERTWEPK